MNAPTDPEVLQRAERQAQVVAALAPLLPQGALLWHAEETTPYECDGLTAYRQRPLVRGAPGDRRSQECRRCSRPAMRWACRWSRAVPVPASRVARCRMPWA